jgi:hypothetical protein
VSRDKSPRPQDTLIASPRFALWRPSRPPGESPQPPRPHARPEPSYWVGGLPESPRMKLRCASADGMAGSFTTGRVAPALNLTRSRLFRAA